MSTKLFKMKANNRKTKTKTQTLGPNYKAFWAIKYSLPVA